MSFSLGIPIRLLPATSDSRTHKGNTLSEYSFALNNIPYLSIGIPSFICNLINSCSAWCKRWLNSWLPSMLRSCLSACPSRDACSLIQRKRLPRSSTTRLLKPSTTSYPPWPNMNNNFKWSIFLFQKYWTGRISRNLPKKWTSGCWVSR